MALTRDFKQTVRERAERDPDFASPLMNEAISSFLGGDSETSRLILRDLVNSTIGFELLAKKLDKPSKSVHRMLSLKGNPTMDNLTDIFSFSKTDSNAVSKSDSPLNPKKDVGRVNRNCRNARRLLIPIEFPSNGHPGFGAMLGNINKPDTTPIR